MQTAPVERVRRFNRVVSQRIGALDDAYLSRGRPLGQARLLWEIGRDGATVRSLRTRLDLDSGYLSRLLRALEADGLVAVGADPADARVRVVRLTPAGMAERAELDRRSDELAGSILDPLSEGQRDRLLDAMALVERMLVASTVRIDEVDPRHPDARTCFQAYYAELAARFTGGFDPGTTSPVADRELTPPYGLLLVARLRGEPVGCGALRYHPDFAEIKRVWIAPAVRGLGLGRRILSALESSVAGVRLLRLDTNRALTEAIAMYRSAGYHEIDRYNDEPYAHHWFEKTLDDSATIP